MNAPARFTILLLLIAASAPALAQLLPRVAVPLQDVPRGVGPTIAREFAEVRSSLERARRGEVRDLLRRYPRDLERDPRGAPIVRSAIVALSPADSALARARTQGFSIQSDESLPALGERVVTLLAPPGLSTRRALDRLRRADPGGRYDFSHLYTQSAGTLPVKAIEPREPQRLPVRAPVAAFAARLGMIDGGLRLDHPALRAASIEASGCGARNVPSAHGTAVASLLVGQAADFSGAAPGLPLSAIDVWCGDEAPGGRIQDVASAMAALAARPVSVMNLSLVGPPNVVLEAIVARVLANGIVIVAAAGNDGPRARPLYPAAYPGVVAVTAVDGHDRALLEAARGPHVRFAAPGADVMAASVSPDYAPVRGTSFAAPVVSGLIAARIAGGDSPAAALLALEHDARDLGRKGRDETYGDGLVGATARHAR